MKSYLTISKFFFKPNAYVNRFNTVNKLFTSLNYKSFCEGIKKGSLISLGENGDLDKVLKESNVPVMVDFYADWCPPCKKLTPLLVNNFNTKKNFTLVKVDVDSNPDLCTRYNVSGIPHVVLINKQKNISSFVGYDEKGLTNMLGEIDKANKL